MRKPSIIIASLIGIILVLSIAQIVVSTRISTTGIALGSIETQTQALKTENLLLNEKILTLSSLTHIASQAAQIGFTTKTAQIVLSNSQPIAIKQ
ncbi:MAG TPA: hypothetical protein VLF68_01360 [Candidatus Saccharimonadales bacterium]|nr:hypothetical protein [Candidatus Saccharimonadales bacterium]